MAMEMPRIIYGTAWKKERTKRLVLEAISAGFHAIDTACQPKHYNEAGVGEAIAELGRRGIPRSSLYIQTKFTSISGQDLLQPLPYNPRAPLFEQVLQSFTTSLKNLQTDYVDCLILHGPLHTDAQTAEVWRA